MNRREFFAASAGGALLSPPPSSRVLIKLEAPETFKTRLAARELVRGLSRLLPQTEVRVASPAVQPAVTDAVFRLRVDHQQFKNPEAYRMERGGAFVAAGEQALLYAVFDFLERQGVFFGIDGESYPFDAERALVVPDAGKPWEASPRFAVRGLLPWPDFLNCISVYNDEDFRAYFESMLRMRFNTFGMHVYTGANQWAESYLSFEFAGAGHIAYLDNTASNRWGYLPERTSRFTMGASQLYDSETFGSDATRLGRDWWDIADRTRAMLRRAFSHAARLGIATGIGFEPYQIPDEIFRALPPEIRPERKPGERGPRFDIESNTARRLLETRLAQLLEAYPDVDYVWLWEDESMNWDSRGSDEKLSLTPFLQAHDFLRRNAPKKRLVLGGWGGVARNFEQFHERLPGDVIFTCLSDSLGWDTIHESFGKLEGRERWPIPWLEDDPAMWLPQFHVHRFEKDMNRAVDLGCQGMLGIHWRHRIVDPNAGFQSRFSWDPKLKPADYYRAYARTQAAGERAARLAIVLDEADRDRKLLATFTGEVKNGHAVTQEFTGDYGEAFAYWHDYEPKPEVMASQKEVAAALAALVAEAQTPAERERVAYLSAHVEFLVPYSEAWVLAHRTHLVLKAALALRNEGKPEAAREKVRAEAVPLWLKLAPEVRSAVLAIQRVAATRNDLGTLASIHNKLVRLALMRLRLSIAEFLDERPAEIEKLFAEITRPDAPPVRVFVPTRPSLLAKGERTRIIIVVTGAEPIRAVTVHTRLAHAAVWAESPTRLLGRRTFEALLGPFNAAAEFSEYYVTADVEGKRVSAPEDAAAGAYRLTLV